MWNNELETYNDPIFHKIADYSQAVAQLGDYFIINRTTDVVVAPGSDMPFVAVRWYAPNTALANLGWPAQAANPAAYVSLMDANQDAEEITNHPILLSHIPTRLQPGIYIPTLPQIAYISDQFDLHHAFPTDAFEWPEVMLKESIYPVEISPYQFTTKALDATDTLYYMPWLLTPIGAGLVASNTNLTWSKALGIGGSNRTGTAQVAVSTVTVYVKNRTFPDGAAVLNTQDASSITAMANNARDNDFTERYCFFKVRLQIDQAGSTPAGVGYIVY
jgi:hypothetical protein